ncbi:unnamed protein product [Pylaiella littoralis]
MTSTPRHDAEQGHQQIWSASRSRGGDGAGGQPSPSPAKARQAQRRYRSLFHQAAKEYRAWREGEDDSQRALGSAFHLLDRLRILQPDGETGGNISLGGLENLPGCRELLIRKHTMELERVMRLWRALVQQMKGQVSRVEESLAEAWQLHRSDPARARRPLHRPAPPPSPSPPLPSTPTTETLAPARETSSPQQQAAVAVGLRSSSSLASHASASGLQQRLSNRGGAGEGGGCGGDAGLPRPPTTQGGAAALAPSPRAGRSSGGQQAGLLGAGGRSGGSQVEAMAYAAVSGGGGVWRATNTTLVGPAEYLQWLGDLSSMMVHEQWRKEELLARVAFGPEAEAAANRAHVQARWSSRSQDSFLDQSVIDAAIASSQLVPPPRSR